MLQYPSESDKGGEEGDAVFVLCNLMKLSID